MAFRRGEMKRCLPEEIAFFRVPSKMTHAKRIRQILGVWKLWRKSLLIYCVKLCVIIHTWLNLKLSKNFLYQCRLKKITYRAISETIYLNLLYLVSFALISSCVHFDASISQYSNKVRVCRQRDFCASA